MMGMGMLSSIIWLFCAQILPLTKELPEERRHFRFWNICTSAGSLLTSWTRSRFPPLLFPSFPNVFHSLQLISFLDFRLQDELADSASAPYLSGIAQRPTEIGRVGVEELSGWLTALRQCVAELSEPRQLQLLRIRTSPRLVREWWPEVKFTSLKRETQKGKQPKKYGLSSC